MFTSEEFRLMYEFVSWIVIALFALGTVCAICAAIYLIFQKFIYPALIEPWYRPIRKWSINRKKTRHIKMMREMTQHRMRKED